MTLDTLDALGVVADPTICRLTRTLDRLRTEQAAILAAHRSLLAYGIGSATEEVYDRLHAIREDARTIAVRLHALGAFGAADDALGGWANTPAVHTASAVTS
jgi:hypothetical protein